MIIWCRPLPNASSRLTATVPQTIPKTVRNVRSFCAAHVAEELAEGVADGEHAARSGVSRRPTVSFFGGRSTTFSPFVNALHDLDVQAVGDADLDVDLLRLGLSGRAGEFDEGLLASVFEDHQALGERQDVLLLADDDVGVGRVAGAEGDLAVAGRARSRRRRAWRLLSAAPAARCGRRLPVTTSVGQRADFDARRHARSRACRRRSRRPCL